jgi:glycosyltransferase involved in cell wall biosynthesis
MQSCRAGKTRLVDVPGVVVITRDRRTSLLHALGRLVAESGAEEVVVVDNGSRDGTARAVRRSFPAIRVVEYPAAGASARNPGVEALDSEVVAFADDDSWWAPGALQRLARAFAHPRLGLAAARILVGDEHRLDPTCRRMRASPLGVSRALGRPRVLGFVACGSAVRRRAFLDAGGFHPLLQIGGEEELLALDLAAAGWELCYFDDIVAHHHPDLTLPRHGRRAHELRNELWVAMLRRPWPRVARPVLELAARATHDAAARRALGHVLTGVAHVLRDRRRLPFAVESDLRRLEEAV